MPCEIITTLIFRAASLQEFTYSRSIIIHILCKNYKAQNPTKKEVPLNKMTNTQTKLQMTGHNIF